MRGHSELPWSAPRSHPCKVDTALPAVATKSCMDQRFFFSFYQLSDVLQLVRRCQQWVRASDHLSISRSYDGDVDRYSCIYPCWILLLEPQGVSPCHSWFYYSFTITTSIGLRTRTKALSVCGISNLHDNRAMNGYGAINRLCPQVLGLWSNSTSALISFFLPSEHGAWSVNSRGMQKQKLWKPRTKDADLFHSSSWAKDEVELPH